MPVAEGLLLLWLLQLQELPPVLEPLHVLLQFASLDCLPYGGKELKPPMRVVHLQKHACQYFMCLQEMVDVCSTVILASEAAAALHQRPLVHPAAAAAVQIKVRHDPLCESTATRWGTSTLHNTSHNP